MKSQRILNLTLRYHLLFVVIGVILGFILSGQSVAFGLLAGGAVMLFNLGSMRWILTKISAGDSVSALYLLLMPIKLVMVVVAVFLLVQYFKLNAFALAMGIGLSVLSFGVAFFHTLFKEV